MLSRRRPFRATSTILTMTPDENRTYLYVVPEERAEVKAAGACWDDNLKCWYITSDMDPAVFSQWLSDTENDDELEITSTEAYVACTQASCRNCRATIEIICIYCESGVDGDELLTHFTVSNIWAMDDALKNQLAPWPNFKKGFSSIEDSEYFANHCPNCHALQEDLFLHDEPGDPFFAIPHAPPASLQLTPLAGPIHLSGDCHFSI